MKSIQKLRTVLIAFVLLGSISQANAKEIIYRKSIPSNNIRELSTDISFFAGNLFMGTETEKTAECLYGFNTVFIEPYVHFEEKEDIGILTIKNKKTRDIPKKEKDSNKWEIELNKNLKNDLKVKMLAGKATIDLSGSKLNRLEYSMVAGETNLNISNTNVPKVIFKMTAGEATIDMTGKWKNDCDAEISGGLGEINLKVPSKVGVKVYITGLLGESKLDGFTKDGKSYTNDAWSKSKNKLNIYVSGGIGQITVEMEE